MPDSPEIDQRIEQLVRAKEWRGILDLLERGEAGPGQTFLIAGCRNSLLPIAIDRNWTDLALYLIQHGAEVNAPKKAMAPILDACGLQNHPVIEALLGAGADVNVKAPRSAGEVDETPLMIAAEKRDLWMVDRLLQAGADPAAMTRGKQSAIHHALMSYAAKPQPDPAAAEIVGKLLDAGCPLLGTELHFAVYRRDPAMAKLLLERGSPVNASFPHNEEDGPKKSETPLTVLADLNGIDMSGGHFGFEPTAERRIELARLLLSAGADPNLPGAKGRTPLRALLPAVAGYGHWEIAEVLIRAGADPHFVPPNTQAESPAVLAARLGLEDFLQLFGTARSRNGA